MKLVLLAPNVSFLAQKKSVTNSYWLRSFFVILINEDYNLVVSLVTVIAVSFTVESDTVVSTVVVIAAVSAKEVSVVSPDFSELQAATDKEIAKAKKPNLNAFFMLSLFKVIN